MDIGSIIEADKLAEVEIKHPVTGKGLGVFVSLYGKHSQTFRSRMNANINKRQSDAASDARNGRQTPPRTVEASQAENEELLAACVHTWRTEAKGKTPQSKLEFHGEWLDPTPSNILKVLQDPNMRWFVEQIDEAVGRLENFTKA